jgi:hypothetical protein
VRGIWRLSPTRDGVATEPLWPRGSGGSLASFVPDDELAQRRQLLGRLASGEIADARELHAAAERLLAPLALESELNGRVASS